MKKTLEQLLLDGHDLLVEGAEIKLRRAEQHAAHPTIATLPDKDFTKAQVEHYKNKRCMYELHSPHRTIDPSGAW